MIPLVRAGGFKADLCDRADNGEEIPLVRAGGFKVKWAKHTESSKGSRS